MIETLKTKLQELNNLSQSLNDQLEQLRQQLDERPRLLSLTSFSGSESDVTDFMSETLSDETLFDEATDQQAVESIDNIDVADVGNENTNTASDVVEQVERTIVTTLFDVSSRLEVVRNQMRAVLDEGFVNDNDGLHFATPALNAIVNNNTTVGMSVNVNHVGNNNYQVSSASDLNGNRLMDTASSLLSAGGGLADLTSEARDGDVHPDHQTAASNSSPERLVRRLHTNTQNVQESSFTDYEHDNVESNHSDSSELDRSYQYSSHGDEHDRDRQAEQVSSGSSRYHSFSDHHSRDDRYLPEHVIVSEPPDSPSNTNSSFTGSCFSIPTISSVSHSRDYPVYHASTPRYEADNQPVWTLDLNSSGNANVHHERSPASLHNSSWGGFSSNRSNSSSRTGSSGSRTDNTHSESDSDTVSSKSTRTSQSQSDNATYPHYNNTSYDTSVTDSSTSSLEHHSKTAESEEDRQSADKNTFVSKWVSESVVHTSDSTLDIVDAGHGTEQAELSSYNTTSDDKPENVESADDPSGRGRNPLNSSMSNDEAGHSVFLLSDTSDESDKSESIKYLTKRLKHVPKESNSADCSKPDTSPPKAEADSKNCAKPATERKDDSTYNIPTSRKRRVCAYNSAYSNSSKKPNLGLPSYSSAPDLHRQASSVLSSHGVSGLDQGLAGRRTRSGTLQATPATQDNAQSLNVKIDLSLINYSGQKSKRSAGGAPPSATVTANVSSLNQNSNSRHDQCSIPDRQSNSQTHKGTSPRTNAMGQNSYRQARYPRRGDSRRSQTRVASPARSASMHSYNTRAFPHSWCDESEMSDSSDDTYVPENEGNETDVTISEEEMESDTSYEVEIPKTALELLDEYASNDTDESWNVGME